MLGECCSTDWHQAVPTQRDPTMPAERGYLSLPKNHVLTQHYSRSSSKYAEPLPVPCQA